MYEALTLWLAIPGAFVALGLASYLFLARRRWPRTLQPAAAAAWLTTAGLSVTAAVVAPLSAPWTAALSLGYAAAAWTALVLTKKGLRRPPPGPLPRPQPPSRTMIVPPPRRPTDGSLPPWSSLN